MSAGEVIVGVGVGSIGQAIARRVSSGRHVVLADLRQEQADAAAEVLSDAGVDVSTPTVDVSSRESVHALVERSTTVGDVMEHGGAGVVIASRSGYRLGIIMTPLANDELSGPRGEGYRRMIDLSPAGRAGTPDEVGTLAALLMGRDGAFITGSDILIDGGVTSSYFYGDLASS